MALINFEKYNVLMDKSYTSQLGKVAKVVGLTIESIGPSAKLNDLCLIRLNNRTEPVKAEVVGFRDDRVLLLQRCSDGSGCICRYRKRLARG